MTSTLHHLLASALLYSTRWLISTFMFFITGMEWNDDIYVIIHMLVRCIITWICICVYKVCYHVCDVELSEWVSECDRIYSMYIAQHVKSQSSNIALLIHPRGARPWFDLIWSLWVSEWVSVCVCVCVSLTDCCMSLPHMTQWVDSVMACGSICYVAYHCAPIHCIVSHQGYCCVVCVK
jgi:hypothetical protein